jgi:outer membrane protein OmpA-like peptidoglycan-associated protein
MTGSTDPQVIKEIGYIFGEGVGVVLVTTLPVVTLTNDEIDTQKNKLAGYFTEAQKNYDTFIKTLNEIKTNLSGKTAQDITIQIESSCSSAATDDYNAKLSLRRSHSIIQDIFDKIKAPDSNPTIQWINDIKPADKKNSDNDVVFIP